MQKTARSLRPAFGRRLKEKYPFTLLFAQLAQGCCDDKKSGLLGVGDNSALIYHGRFGS
jgi:hypothetical protein